MHNHIRCIEQNKMLTQHSLSTSSLHALITSLAVIYFQNAVRPQVFVGGLCSSCWDHHDVWDNRVFDPFTWVWAPLCVLTSHLKFCAVMVVIEENTVPKMISYWLEYLCIKYTLVQMGSLCDCLVGLYLYVYTCILRMFHEEAIP